MHLQMANNKFSSLNKCHCFCTSCNTFINRYFPVKTNFLTEPFGESVSVKIASVCDLGT